MFPRPPEVPKTFKTFKTFKNAVPCRNSNPESSIKTTSQSGTQLTASWPVRAMAWCRRTARLFPLLSRFSWLQRDANGSDGSETSLEGLHVHEKLSGPVRPREGRGEASEGRPAASHGRRRRRQQRACDFWLWLLLLRTAWLFGQDVLSYLLPAHWSSRHKTKSDSSAQQSVGCSFPEWPKTVGIWPKTPRTRTISTLMRFPMRSDGYIHGYPHVDAHGYPHVDAHQIEGKQARRFMYMNRTAPPASFGAGATTRVPKDAGRKCSAQKPLASARSVLRYGCN